MATARLGMFMRKEQRKLLFQWSMVLTVSIIFMLLLSGNYNLIYKLNELRKVFTSTFSPFSKYFCLWANKQWKDVYDGWYNGIHSGRHI